MILRRPTYEQLLSICSRLEMSEVHERVDMDGAEYDPVLLASRLVREEGPAHVFLDDKRVPYFAAGFTLDRPGVMTAWSVSTVDCPQHVLEMTRVSRKVIKVLLGNGIHRINIMCKDSRGHARRWYESLGAVHECTLKAFGANGADFALYTILRGAR